MVCKLANTFVCWQLRKGFISSENKEVFQYGYELFFSLIFNFIVATVVAVIFSSIFEVFIFYLSYSLLRSFAGGYHARDYEKCMVVSGSVIIIACILFKIVALQWYPIVGAVNILLSVPAIWKLAPVEDLNKPLDKLEKSVFQKRARFILALEVFFAVVFFIIGWSKIGFVISLSFLILCITLIMGKIKNRNLLLMN